MGLYPVMNFKILRTCSLLYQLTNNRFPHFRQPCRTYNCSHLYSRHTNFDQTISESCEMEPEMVMISKKKRSSPHSPQPVLPAATSRVVGHYFPAVLTSSYVYNRKQERVRANSCAPSESHHWLYLSLMS